MRKYQLTFEFKDTEEQAKEMVASLLKSATPYIRKNKSPHYTPWTSSDQKEHKFIVWYYY